LWFRNLSSNGIVAKERYTVDGSSASSRYVIMYVRDKINRLLCMLHCVWLYFLFLISKSKKNLKKLSDRVGFTIQYFYVTHYDYFYFLSNCINDLIHAWHAFSDS